MKSGVPGRGINQLIFEQLNENQGARDAASIQNVRKTKAYREKLAAERQRREMASQPEAVPGVAEGSAEDDGGPLERLRQSLADFEGWAEVCPSDWNELALGRVCEQAVRGEEFLEDLDRYLRDVFKRCSTESVKAGGKSGRRPRAAAPSAGRKAGSRRVVPKARVRNEGSRPALEVFGPDQQASGDRNPTSRAGPVLNRSARKRLQYLMTQRLYNKNLSRLAHTILDGKPVIPKPIEAIPGVVEGWVDSFEEKPEGIDVSEMVDFPSFSDEVWRPIECDEASAWARRATGCPGPDGVTVKLVKSIRCCVLARIFNLILYARKLPASLKKSKTVLIPKVDDPKIHSDFRPISVSSVLVRLLHKILANRILKACHMDIRQRGFLAVDGCAENSAILEAVIGESRRHCRSAFIMSLDIKNAFGSVSHEALLAALERGGASRELIEYVRDLYSDYYTEVSFGSETKTAKINRGCLQGCGLSPVLFNLVINQLLAKLPDAVGVTLGRGEHQSKVGSAAFADDLITFAGTELGCRQQLSALEKYGPKLGLVFNGKKCNFIALQKAAGKTRKVVVRDDIVLKIHGVAIPCITTLQKFKYLGVMYSADGPKEAMPILLPLLERLQRAALKPQQKLTILRTYLLPKFIHTLTMSTPTQKLWRGIDKSIRKYLTGSRGFLHLPVHLTRSVYSAPVSEGGLGLMEFETSVPTMIFRRLNRLSASDSPHARAAFSSDIIQDKLARVEKLLKFVNIDGETQRVETGLLVRRYQAQRLHSSVDGQALVEASKSRAANTWVAAKGSMMQGRHFVQALKIRFNCMPVLSVLRRGSNASRYCRAGCYDRIETLDHVLGSCRATRLLVNIRHDTLRDTVAKFLRDLKYTVVVEPRIRLTEQSDTSEQTRAGSFLQPDLLCFKADKSYCIDVCVWAGSEPLYRTHGLKCHKYDLVDIKDYCKRLEPNIQSYTPGAVAFNVRGILAGKSARFLDSLGFTRGMINHLAVIVMEKSVKTFECFSRQTGSYWRSRNRARPK